VPGDRHPAIRLDRSVNSRVRDTDLMCPLETRPPPFHDVVVQWVEPCHTYECDAGGLAWESPCSPNAQPLAGETPSNPPSRAY
jgi:hypothetical protein